MDQLKVNKKFAAQYAKKKEQEERSQCMCGSV